MARENCWQRMNCGREPGGQNAADQGVCPAATDTLGDGANGGTRSGRICWDVAGTFCCGAVQGSFAAKELSCFGCDFFKFVQNEEGPGFVLLRQGQGLRRRRNSNV